MATSSTPMNPGLGHVLVEFSYQYEGRDGSLVQIQPNERYELLSKTNSHWWQVRSGPGFKPFYIPAKYVRELPQVPELFPDPIGTEKTPAPSPTPLPVPVPTLPKIHDDARKPSDQVMIRLRPDAGHRKAENRMSTFGVPLDLDLSGTTNMASTNGSGTTTTAVGRTTKGSGTTNTTIPRTSNGSGTTNLVDSPRAPAHVDSAPIRHQPIPVEIPRAPPTKDTVPKRGKQEVQEEATPKQGRQEVTAQGRQEVTAQGRQEVTAQGRQEVTAQGRQEVVFVEEEELCLEEEPSESEEERDTSHIYESIQELHLDLDALIGPGRTHKQEVESEAPSLAQELVPCPIYANVTKPIPPPPSEPAPAAPCPAPDPDSDPTHLSPGPTSSASCPLHSVSGSSSGLSPASPLSPLDGWQGGDWERLVDEVSGRFYFFNPSTGATSWALPEPHPPSSSNRPSLPEEVYPLVDDSVFASLPQRMMGNGVLEDVGVWKHSVAEDRLYPVRRHASDLTDTPKGHTPGGPQLSDRLKLRRNLSNRSADSHLHGHLLEKAGIVNKTKVCDNGKKIRKNWSQSWTVLHGGILTFHKDPKTAPTGTNSKASQIVPEFTVELRGASVHWVHNKSSKKNVIELRTRQGCEILMQYDTESIIIDWFKVISDSIRQLDWDHQSEDSDDSDKDDKDRKRISSRSCSGAESEQRRVRHKLRRFLQRRPTLQSVKEKGYIRDAVFGCHMDVLCHRENSSMPRFVEKCVRFVERHGLDSDGIYRVSGNLSVIQRLRHKADQEEDLCIEDGQWTEIHVVTGALKLFFRELPEPLFPFSSYNKFIAAIQLGEYSQRVDYIKDLVQTLPLPNHSTMELLFRHLRRVVDHKEQNRMSVQSLAIVFGPTLLRPQTESNLTIHMVFQSQIVELVLNEFNVIFTKK